MMKPTGDYWLLLQEAIARHDAPASLHPEARTGLVLNNWEVVALKAVISHRARIDLAVILMVGAAFVLGCLGGGVVVATISLAIAGS